MSCSGVVTTELALAHLLADAADQISLHHFGSDTLRVETKADGTPVTAVDRAVEDRIRALLATHRPDDGFLGEEAGHSGPARRRWIIDGVDGTHNYVRHNPGWGTLIALEEDGEIVRRRDDESGARTALVGRARRRRMDRPDLAEHAR